MTTSDSPSQAPSDHGATSSTPDAPRGELQAGSMLGPYEIVRLLGEGGMGAVYEGRHRTIGRRVAIKVLRTELATDVQVLERFLREARAAIEVHHRNIVEVTDFGAENGRAYLVMEYLTGESLRAVIEREAPMPAARVARLMAPICRALAHAHSKSVIHRDIKPDNIFIATEDGSSDVVPKVVDFGIAHARSESDVRLTTTGAWMGTPLYMAPEQAGGAKDVTPAADQYALGCILYEALTGEPPILSDTYNGLVLAKATTDPVPLATRRPDVPAELADAVMRSLARAPRDRFDSLLDLGAILEAVDARPSDAPSRRISVELAATVAKETGTPFSWSRRSTPTPEHPSAPAPEGLFATSPAHAAEPAVPVRRPSRRIALAAAAAVVVAVGTIGGLVVTQRSRSTSASAERSVPVGPRAARSQGSTPPSEATGSAVIRFEFEPASAQIRLDGQLLGVGSASTVVPRDARPRELRVTADGFAPMTRVVTADHDDRIAGRLAPLETPSQPDAGAATVARTGDGPHHGATPPTSSARQGRHGRLGSSGLIGADEMGLGATRTTRRPP